MAFRDYNNWNPGRPDWVLSLAEVINNTQVYIETHGLDQIPKKYRLLIQFTQSFIDSVNQLARLPQSLASTATLLIDFGDNLLKTKNTCLQHMLNSQRCHLISMLDDALLKICIDEWEKPVSPSAAPEVPWNQTIAPISRRLAKGLTVVPVWDQGVEAIEDDKVLGWRHSLTWSADGLSAAWMQNCYFARTRRFLQESMGVYGANRKVNACIQGRLPKELVDEIVDGVLEHENLPRGRLRRKYFASGK